MKQYKVVSEGNWREFEHALNAAAEKGYSVVSSYTISEEGTDYFVAVMELSW